MKASQKYKNSVFRNIYEQPYNERTRLKLYNSAKGNVDFIQRLALQRSLPVHNGCVNCICWNDTGEYLLSGSDDQYLAISHAYNFKMLTHYKTSHRANIFSAKFLPCSGDKNIVSCSGDGIILFTDLFRASETRNNQFNCHKGTTYEIATVPNEPHTFLSCGEDFTVRSYDLRIKEKCDKENCLEDVLILCQRAVTALSINSVRPYQMAIGCADSTVRIFDRRMIAGTRASGCVNMGKGPRPFATFTAPGMEDRSYRITSLGFSPQGEDVLVSYSSEHLYLFSIKDESTMEYEPVISEDQEEDEEEDEGSARVASGLPPVRRLRLRGDWSDTGPDARPERDAGRNTDAAQARPTLHATLMQRMTDVLSRMLNDPATRAALSHGGEDDHHDFAQDSQNRGPEDPSGVRNVPEDSPVVAVSIEGVYPEADPVEVASDVASDPNWSPPLASPTLSPAEDTVQLPSFESSFASVAPSSPASALVSIVPPPPLATVPSPVLEPVAEGSSLPSVSPMLDAVPVSTDENLPSTSTSTSSTSSSKDNLTSLTDQLSTMRHGFIERHGMEPVVNLMYSDKGSTASRISLSVADEVNREAFPQSQEELAGPSSESELLETSSVPTVVATEPMSEGEDFAVDSDDEMAEVITQSIRRNISDRSPHDIEKEMDEAIKNSRPNTTMSDKVKIMKPTVRQKFTGHRNARTMIKEATFWGEDYVLSGSDCGHVFVWDRMTAKLVMLLEADHHVVNCLQPHPFLPLLATSGIDYDVKLWAPILPEPSFNLEMAEELVKRNEVMLEETRDTITVPASFMIRMLACLNQIRRGARSRVRRTDNANGDQSQE